MCGSEIADGQTQIGELESAEEHRASEGVVECARVGPHIIQDLASHLIGLEDT